MYIVKYKGNFGFIKPYSSYRDDTIFSQQFLNKSTLIGIELKIFEDYGYVKNGQINKIKRHKLKHSGFTEQQEVVKSPNQKYGIEKGECTIIKGGTGILKRNLLLSPELLLAFDDKESAEIAADNIIRISRNEDFLIPEGIFEMTTEEFDVLSGFETFEDEENGILCGFNRFDDYKPMIMRIDYAI